MARLAEQQQIIPPRDVVVEIPAWREHRIVFACHLCFDGNKRVGDEIEGTAGARRGERSGHALEKFCDAFLPAHTPRAMGEAFEAIADAPVR